MHAGKYIKQLTLPRAHPVPHASRLDKILHRLYERRRPITLRCWARRRRSRNRACFGHGSRGDLRTPPSRRDPVRYSFAHGGKDGYPKPVDRKDYETSIHVLETALKRARIGQTDRLHALRRLARWQDGG